ncbi:BZ3500_MvSof-1268-A1-R1_Chr2-2g05089 [Microbotryum saponariae]|uniref:BZ3500_MvSof-1268-A1-R1_Chr2-2g05089 protein n=1 Tax=Microbotryum saponariae TaxID=289078 RepID=A0A2X0KX29_9BASI|nr:BZ3500_MvSof-1268-A1-R1_Chr2-2g05089 [Microbotryum saponariae]SDA00886.1 BZ3501_MvSof-1269-A2-R1_Chr2-2g04763 [Microbotryum saponariae]
MFRLAVRSPVARVAVATPRMATRSFLTSLRRQSEAEPIIQRATSDDKRPATSDRARATITTDRTAADTFPSHLPQGPGGKPGQVPTDLEQATGLERFELLMKLKGEEAFSLDPLEVTRLGTVQDPISVFSLVRRISCWCRRMSGEKSAVVVGLGGSGMRRGGNSPRPSGAYSGADNTRIVGCTGFPVDSHDTILFPINKEKPVRCPECGCAYKVDFQGVEDHGHGHH